MNEVTLECMSTLDAQIVFNEHAEYFGAGASNTVHLDGKNVVIKYFDKRWPRDIAEWAAEQGHSSVDVVERLKECLQQSQNRT